MAMRTLEFWYDFASPYAYMAAMRIDGLAAAAAVGTRWRPFLVGPLLAKLSATGSPYQSQSEAERRYRRRDVARWCACLGLPLVWPSRYPRASLLAARVALIGGEAGWGETFARRVFHANFAEDRDIAEAPVVAALLAELGLEAESVLDRATTPEIKDRLKATVAEAEARGLFGTPSFLVGEELFWGNDRLEQAIEWAVDGGRLAPVADRLLRGAALQAAPGS